MGQDLWQKQGSGKLNIVGQHALHLGRVQALENPVMVSCKIVKARLIA